jgi:hypothetical protein
MAEQKNFDQFTLDLLKALIILQQCPVALHYGTWPYRKTPASRALVRSLSR